MFPKFLKIICQSSVCISFLKRITYLSNCLKYILSLKNRYTLSRLISKYLTTSVVIFSTTNLLCVRNWCVLLSICNILFLNKLKWLISYSLAYLMTGLFIGTQAQRRNSQQRWHCPLVLWQCLHIHIITDLMCLEKYHISSSPICRLLVLNRTYILSADLFLIRNMLVGWQQMQVRCIIYNQTFLSTQFTRSTVDPLGKCW